MQGKSGMSKWELYYPSLRYDARFLGYDRNEPMIDTRFPELRCGMCHKRSDRFDSDIPYCSYCGSKMEPGSVKLVPDDEFDIAGYAEKYEVKELFDKLEAYRKVITEPIFMRLNMNEKCCTSDMVSEALSSMYQNLAAYEKENCNVANAIEGKDNGDKLYE